VTTETVAPLRIPSLPDDILGAALAYAAAGWYVLPVDRATKNAGSVLRTGWQMKSSREPDRIAAWFAGTDHGLALHVGRSGAVAFDVDHPDELPDELADLLRPAPFQSTRLTEPSRGHYVFACPTGRSFRNSPGKLGSLWGDVRGRNGIVVAEPTVHSTPGGRYLWTSSGTLPMLPEGLAGRLVEHGGTDEDAATDAEVKAWLAAHPIGMRPGRLRPILDRYRTKAAGSRHVALTGCMAWLCKEVNAGYLATPDALRELKSAHTAALSDPGHRNGADPNRRDFWGVLAWAVAQAAGDPLVDGMNGSATTIEAPSGAAQIAVAATEPAPEGDPVRQIPATGGADPFAAAGHRRVVLTPASSIKPRRVKWLWHRRLALGTLGLLAGREDLGKSTLGYWLTGAITRGTLPGEYNGSPRAVLVCATEDSWEHTIVPRLIAADADLHRVFRVDVLSADDIHLGLSLPRDLVQVEQQAGSTGAALLLLDPLMSRLGDDLDTHRDGDVRRALEPLVAVADKCGMAVLGLIHHNKSGSTDPLQLVMGSKAFTAVARSVHTVVPDPDDETGERRLFGTPKNNLGRSDLPTLAFTIGGYPVATEDGTAWTGRLEWGAEVTETIGETMRRAATSDDERSAVSEAAEWLADYLELNGGKVASADVKKDAARVGHSYDAAKRARRKLRLTVESEGFPRRTYWITAGRSQLEQQSEQTPRGEFIAALTTPTGQTGPQSEQWEQPDGDGGSRAPTGVEHPHQFPGLTCGNHPPDRPDADCFACSMVVSA